MNEKKLLKLGEDFKKLKAQLESSRKVNEELRKENDEIIPELRSKNMIQFQEIKKLKEENKFLDEKVSYLCQTHKKSIEKLSEMHEKEVIELKNHARIGIKLQKKNKELKEENKELKEENEAQYIITNDIEQHEDYEEYFGIIKKLEEEIKELKSNLKISHNCSLKLLNRTIELNEEIKLKDEIIRLHES